MEYRGTRQIIGDEANRLLSELEKKFDSDVIFFYGPIYFGRVEILKFVLEGISDNSNNKRLTIIINTLGGEVETVEKIVDMTRFFYDEVYFIVPNCAMSAGTILCMSGDKIFMDYASSLGPIDPQVFNRKTTEFVPALGYLDQVEKMLNKSKKNLLTDAELAILMNMDLATLSRYEQARNLTVTLLEKWLTLYSFKKLKQTPEQKKRKAAEIAKKLGDNKLWHSHGRHIGLAALKDIGLDIVDYSNNKDINSPISLYNKFMLEYINKEGFGEFVHSRLFF